MHSRLASTLLLAALGATTALAQEGHTRPVGYLVQTIPAGQTRSFSIPFDSDVSSLPGTVGRVTAVGSTYIENANANWTPGAFTTPEAPYFVRITSGAQAGRLFRIITPANTATRLNLDDDGLGLVSLGLATGDNGTQFELLPGDTLASFFGTTTPTNTLVTKGAGTANDADLVQVWSGASWLNFYYNTTWQRWARDVDVQASPTRNHYLLRPDRGLMIIRRDTTPLEISVLGRVLNTPQRAFHARAGSTLTFLATMQPFDTTLGALALQTAAHSTAWRGDADPANADIIQVWGGASWLRFYFNSATGHWQRVGDPVNRDTFVIRAGVPVLVQRLGTGTSADEKTIIFSAPGT